MQKRTLAALAVALLLAPLASAGAPTPSAPRLGTPVTTAPSPASPSLPDPWWQRSALDLDRDGVHDSLEAIPLSGFPTVVVVDYAVLPGDGDRGNLERLGLEVGLVLPSLLAITASASSLPQIRAAAALPETVMIESAGRPYQDLDVANGALKARES